MTNSWTGALNMYPGTGTTISLTTDTKVLLCSAIAVNGSGSVVLVDGLTYPTATVLTHTMGTLKTDGASDVSGLSHSWGKYATAGTSTKILNLGNSTIVIKGTATPWNCVAYTGLTVIKGTSLITLSGASAAFMAGQDMVYNNIAFTGGGTNTLSYLSNYNNITYTGTASITCELQIGATVYVSGALTLIGNSDINRALIRSNSIGSGRGFTLGPSGTCRTAGTQYVDFQDIPMTGGATNERDLSAITGGAGDCGGNTGITFTTAATQTWDGTTGSWSASGKWTSRIPLPQDDVVIGAFGGAGRTLTVDVSRMGKNIDFSGVTNNPTILRALVGGGYTYAIYGSLTLSPDLTIAWGTTGIFDFQGRGNSTITYAGKSIAGLAIDCYGGSLTQLDAGSLGASLYVTMGTYDLNEYNLTLGGIFQSSGNFTRSLDMSNAIVTLTSSTATWDIQTMIGLTVITTGSTLAFTGSAGAKVHRCLSGTSPVYNNLIAADGLQIRNTCTIANLTVNSNTTTKAITAYAGITITLGSSNFLQGASGQVTSIATQTAGSPFILYKPSGVVSTEYISLKDCTASGSAQFFAGKTSTNISGNTNWLFSSARVISPSGGMWESTSTWVEGIVPASGDYVFGIASSSGLTINNSASASCQSFDLTNYTGTWSGSGALLIVPIAGVTGAMYASGNVTWVGPLTLSPASGAQLNLTSTGKFASNTNDLTINDYGTVSLQDSLTISATKAVILAKGKLFTNNFALDIGYFSSPTTNARQLELGTSTITTRLGPNSWFITSSSMSINATGSTIILSAITSIFTGGTSKSYGTVIINGGGGAQQIAGGTMVSFNTLTLSGSVSVANTLSLTIPVTINTALNISGQSPSNRLLLLSATVGTARTITNNGTVNISNTDFQDITGAGTASWDLSGSVGGAGDCGGNTGITFTPAEEQTWSGAAGSWSESGLWTSRSPLPQDDVIIGEPLVSGNLLTADMLRLGKNITVTNTVSGKKPNLGLTSQANTIYGSLTLVSSTYMIFSNNKAFYFAGRSDAHLVSAGNSFTTTGIYKPGCALIADDAFIGQYFRLSNGTFTTNSNVTLVALDTISTGTTINMGDGVWTSQYGVSNVGTPTINPGNSTLVIGTASNSFTFQASTCTFNNITIVPGTGILTFSGAFTVNNLSRAGSGTKPIKFTSGTKVTLTGNDFFRPYDGTDTGTWAVSSTTTGVSATMSKASDVVYTDYVALTDIGAVGGATFYAGSHSVDNGGNPGWSFTDYITGVATNLLLNLHNFGKRLQKASPFNGFHKG
jgi:hypothetical protein